MCKLWKHFSQLFPHPVAHLFPIRGLFNQDFGALRMFGGGNGAVFKGEFNLNLSLSLP